MAAQGTSWAWTPRFVDQPGLRAAAVGQVADEPVTHDRGRHAGAGAPDHEPPAARQIKRRRDRQLLQHPGPLQEAVEPVLPDAAQVESGRVV